MSDQNVGVEMPKYDCHKQVWALKIKEVANAPDMPGYWIHSEEEGYAPIKVDIDYIVKHKPQAGGYYVVYEDGYKSFSPAAAFESGYSLVTG